MSYQQSTNFLLLKNHEQIQILEYLKRTPKYFKHYQRFYNLYNQKLYFLKNYAVRPKDIEEKKEIIQQEENLKENIEEKKEENENALEKIKLEEEKLKENYKKYKKTFLKQNKLKKLIEGKNVVVVGPASYIKNMKQGNYIDKFDMIIRFNNNFVIEDYLSVSLGSRTDILVYNFKDPNVIDKLLEEDYSKLKMVFCPYPRDEESIQEELLKAFNYNNINLDVEFLEKDFYSNLMTALDGLPNSFIILLLTLLRQNVKNLYVTGFSFLYDGYYDSELNIKKREEIDSGKIIIMEKDRGNQMKLIKKVYNSNDKLYFDNGLIHLLYGGLMSIFNNVLVNQNLLKLYSTLFYELSLPLFMKKYCSPRLNTKLLVLFGDEEITQEHSTHFHLIFHSNRGKYNNEVYVSDTNDIDINIKNKGNVYFSNSDWNKLKEKIPSKNWNYVLSHHFYVNGNIYKTIIEKLGIDIDLEEKPLCLVYVLLGLISYGKKLIYVNRENMNKNGLIEIYNVLNKINLVKNISL